MRDIFCVFCLTEFTVECFPTVGDHLIIWGDSNDFFPSEPGFQASKMDYMDTTTALARWEKWVQLSVIFPEAKSALWLTWLRLCLDNLVWHVRFSDWGHRFKSVSVGPWSWFLIRFIDQKVWWIVINDVVRRNEALIIKVHLDERRYATIRVFLISPWKVVWIHDLSRVIGYLSFAFLFIEQTSAVVKTLALGLVML